MIITVSVPAVIADDAQKQANINATVEQIGADGIHPIGYMLFHYVRIIWTNAPGEQIMWPPAVLNIYYPIYRIEDYRALMNSSAASKLGGTIRIEKDGRMRAILSDGKRIFVLDRNRIAYSAPANQYKFIPSDSSIAWDPFFYNRLI